ncbi:NADPH-dependent oxidoreductase [Pseudooceanicola sp. GBMRC 2024]|uniref:NADPH-dependent oxidoreductase n=1 Tax=Pseudooceanicola albus TaxID=2692189 RepID=A0A6L7G1J4_9RHOB|nr:NADPH-dependent oxidoreductase [Pseudooceanicola albus]MXN17789.1 NADPH-dependent oxidoreductase [Pseudooceanicola albus]
MEDILRLRGLTPPGPAPDSALHTILGHRSCRAYLPDPVPEALMRQLLAAAQSAPSSCNLQAWSVVRVTAPARKAQLAALSGGQSHVAEAPVLLCFLADLARPGAVAEDNGVPSETLDYLETLLVGVIDATLAAQNLATAAEGAGLGTCYLGGMRNDIAAVARILDLPPRVAPVFGLTLGYPDPVRPAAPRPRLPVQSQLHEERYDRRDPLRGVADYEAHLAAFNRAQGREVPPWGLQSARRLATPERMEGRDGLAGALAALGLARR